MSTQTTFVPTFVPTPLPSNKDVKNSTFCTCNNMIIKNCEGPSKRVNSYNKGLTEFNYVQKPTQWGDIMPYDIFISKKDYEKRNQGWYDPLSIEYYQNLSMNEDNNQASQVFAQNQQYLRQQQALNQGFIGYDFRSWAGNR